MTLCGWLIAYLLAFYLLAMLFLWRSLRGRKQEPILVSTTLLVLTCMRYPLIKKEDAHGYTRQSSLVARAGRVFDDLPGALPSPGGRGRLGALLDRAAHRTAQQELRYYGGGRPRDQRAAVSRGFHQHAVG